MFSFRQHAWVPAAPGAVRDVLVDLEHYPQWWPQVVAVASLGPDDARVLCRSTLPYTLDLVMHAVSRELPVLEVALAGHLRGWVRWRLAASDGGTSLDLAQEVTVHGVLAPFAGALSPLARWNHRRMMASGLAGLRARVTQ
ncbi:SRPBCC family protein [Nocardioides sp. AN3]